MYPPIVIVYLKWGVPILYATHVVKPSLSSAALTAMRSTQETHHSVRGGRELYVLAGLVNQVVELLTHMVRQ